MVLVARQKLLNLLILCEYYNHAIKMSAPVAWDAKLVIGQRARPRPAVAASNSSLNGVSCILLSSLVLLTPIFLC